jgi:hypothetical protein
MLFTKCAVVLKLCTQYTISASTMAPFQFEYIKIEYFDSVGLCGFHDIKILSKRLNNQCEHNGCKITTNNKIQGKLKTVKLYVPRFIFLRRSVM